MITLTKTVKDLHGKNFKTPKKKKKKKLRMPKDGRLSHAYESVCLILLKIAILPKTTYMFNITPSKFKTILNRLSK